MGDYRSLQVWRLAHLLTLEVYRVTRCFPTEERYGLTGQMRRAAASIPTNLAEGCGRDTDGELVRFTRIALGSAAELEYELLLSRELDYLGEQDFARLSRSVDEVKRKLANLAGSLAKRG
jgi:four helix bundle protein